MKFFKTIFKARKIFSKKRIFYIGFISLVFIISIFLLQKDRIINRINSQYSNIVVSECRNNRNWQICYGNKLALVTKLVGFDKAIDILDKIQTLDQRTNNCHTIAHKIAQEQVRKNPSEWLAILKHIKDPYRCFTGFIHGVVEGKKASSPELSLEKATIEILCKNIVQNIKQKNLYPCGHAIGHVLLVQTEANVSDSVNICLSLAGDLERGCLDGVFMENIFKTNLSEHGITWPQGEITENYLSALEYTCGLYKGNAEISCWREISQAYYKITGPNLTKLFNYCMRGKTEENIKACYFRSFNFALIDKQFSNSQLSALCSPFISNREDIYSCYDWAITGLILTSDVYQTLINEICNTAPGNFSGTCWQLKKDRLQMYKY